MKRAGICWLAYREGEYCVVQFFPQNSPVDGRLRFAIPHNLTGPDIGNPRHYKARGRATYSAIIHRAQPPPK